ncbi:MAG: cytochrome c [Planctomycetes bacterium]|nr:cytochrome c [Planctomycetota bacterium]
MPRIFIFAGLIGLMCLLLPPAIIARVRSTPNSNLPIRIVQDMAFQSKYKTQAVNPLFADRNTMRPPVPNAVARGETYIDTHLYDGVIEGQWANVLPEQIATTFATLKRGQERFNIYCSVCHGLSGYGNGIINQRAMELVANANGPVNGTVWVAAKNLVHDEAVVVQPVGQIFNTITYGIRNMAGYGSQIPTEDRWAIAAYVKALQRSQNAQPSDVPPGTKVAEAK